MNLAELSDLICDVLEKHEKNYVASDGSIGCDCGVETNDWNRHIADVIVTVMLVAKAKESDDVLGVPGHRG